MSYKLAAERRAKMIQMLQAEGKIVSSDLAKEFNVSLETIRKDLLYLHSVGVVSKTYGGAVSPKPFAEMPYLLTSTVNIGRKKTIAQKAVKLIPANGIILLDAGSTCMELAKALGSTKGLTVVTNSTMAACVLAKNPNIQLFVAGGEVRGMTFAQVGSWTTNALKQIKVNVAFIGANAMDEEGVYTPAFSEAEIKGAMMACAETVAVVADVTKFKNKSFVKVASWDLVDYLVTDADVPDQIKPHLPEKMKII